MPLSIARRATHASGLPQGLHPVLWRAYTARGIRSAEELALGLERLTPIGSLEEVEAAVDLLIAHRERSILVIGDFDADGATSTALIVRALRAWGFASVDFLVPNRFEYGYGLTPEIVALASERNPALIVTVDNGISSVAGVAAARARGIDVLVTDHHLPGTDLPTANVIVNPNRPGSQFASRTLAGVGVAFYVMAALRRRLLSDATVSNEAPSAAEYLDLVALGTVADLVPLDANNRVLVSHGLKRIRAGRCVPGIRALLKVAKRSPETLTAADLGFSVGPRLNAAGRLDDMSIGIRCLLADSEHDAFALAERLDQLNAERRAIEAKMQIEALAAVKFLREPQAVSAATSMDPRFVDRAGVCLFDESWHQGVVGLVAGKIKERIRRPVIAFARTDTDWLRGSARSVPGIHIRDVLDAVAARHPELLQRFGGHAMAAGLTLEARHLDAFARAFDLEVTRALDPNKPANTIETDGELCTEEITLETAHALREGGPWGQAFPEPCFDGLFSVKSARRIGDRHVKMWLETAAPSRRAFDAIAFNFLDPNEPQELPTGDVRVVYRLDINEYQGERRLQLLVDHVFSC
jgi:single-stranded-DNA-specific exonuclease